MAKLDFVDTHVHFYDMQHPELFYWGGQPGVHRTDLDMQIQKLAERNYIAEDYIAETRNANVTKAVHVQAATGTKDPVKETEWLQEAADRTGFPHGIVAYADLRGPGAQEVLERHLEYPNMRGIRGPSSGDILVTPDYHRGFALLERYNLVPSMGVPWPDMEKLRDLAATFPNIVIVVGISATFPAESPRERSEEYFAKWQRGMAIAAEADNIRCKISGLGMRDNNWTVDSIRPYVLHCIETFGADRCFFGTNWPVDWLWSSYDAVVDAYTEIIAGSSGEEQAAMFSKNAEAIYNI